MSCNGRQLTQAELEAGFAKQRTGIVRGIRPFTQEATPENIAAYLNDQVFPLLQQARQKVNDVYLQVTDNAPSANPLSYYFSTETGAADPTAGRMRLNQATQDTATTIRVSQSNGRLVDVAPWLDVMAGSATEPLGVLTLSDAINPGRFIRFDLDTMTDQGAYWELGVTPIESSHDSPFVEGEALVASFVPGVASGGGTGGGAIVPPGSFGDQPEGTLLGQLYDDTDSPAEAWTVDSLAGDGLEATTGIGSEASPFPEVISMTSFSNSTSATSAVITLPAARQERDRIIIVINAQCGSVAQDFSAVTGWTEVANKNTAIAGGSAVFERIIADGETLADTVTIGYTQTGGNMGYVLLIRGGHLTQTSAVVSEVSNSSVATIDPAPLFPAFGEANTLWISALALTLDTAVGSQVTAFPSYLTTTDQVEIDNAGGSIDGNVAIGHAQLRTVGVDPSSWTWTSACPSMAYTVAVPPRPTVQLALSEGTSVPGETIVMNPFDEADEARAMPIDDVLGASLTHTVSVGSGPFPEPAVRQTFLFAEASTSHAVPLIGLSEGQAVLMFVQCGTAVTPNIPAVHTGWVSLATLGASTQNGRVFWLPPVDAAEAANTAPELVTFATAQTCIVRIWVIDDHNRTQNPTIVSAVNTTAATSSADPATITPVPGDGSAAANYTYIAMLGLAGEENTITAFPAGYTNTGQDSISGASNLDALIGYAELEARGSSENPGAWTYTASSNGRHGVATVALIPRPAAEIQRAALTGAVAASQDSNATTFAGIRDNGVAENDRTNLNFVSSTSVTLAVTDDSGNDELEITAQRAALTGAIAASANSNATLFAGIRDNGAAESDRTNLNFVSSTSATAVVTDDSVNDELEVTFQRAALTGAIAASANANATLFSGVLSHGASTTDRTNIDFRHGTKTLLSYTDDSGSDSIRLSYGVDESQGFAWTGAHSFTQEVALNGGAHVPTGEFIGFGSAGSLPATGDIRVSSTLTVVTAIGSEFTLGNAMAYEGDSVFLSSANTNFDVNVNGCQISGTSPYLQFAEAATSVLTNAAGIGSFWVRSDTPNTPMFTDDANADFVIARQEANMVWTGTHEFDGTTQFDLASTFNGAAVFSGDIRLDDVISPTITADQNNWNPTGFSTCNVVRTETDATPRTVTGMVPPSDNGHLRLFCNSGSASLTFAHQSASSTDVNRIICPGAASFVLSTNESIFAWYDFASNRWRLVAF